MTELLFNFERKNYKELSATLVKINEVVSSLTPKEAERVCRLLSHLQKELKLKEKELLESLENREKVKDSYGKCSL